MDTTHIHFRDARDRLIDLLGIGQTYPLRDLAVRDTQLTVAFDTPASIPIEESQAGVLYQLQHRDGTPVSRQQESANGPVDVPVEAEGNGDTLRLETRRIQEDITFQIHARKLRSGRAATLHQTATVKVGLDVSLQAWLLNAALLEPGAELPAPTAPRLVSYGTRVEVEIQNSQEGVDYDLVALTSAGDVAAVLSEASERGNLHNLVLRSQALYEDIDIRIRATKTFDCSEDRLPESDLLEIALPLRVRANPVLSVTVAVALIDFQQSATITIAATQPSVQYRLYLRTIPDRDILHTAVPAPEAISVPVAEKPAVQIGPPDWGEVWVTPEGYTVVSELLQGIGGDLQYTTDALTDETLFIVEARKAHQLGADRVIMSAVSLQQAAVVLVRPNPMPPLRLRQMTGETMQVSGGQPGVLYYLRRVSDGIELALPAYFHQRDATNPQENKGLDQLVIEVDFVIAPDHAAMAVPAAARLAELPPEAPILEAGGLAAETAFTVRAVKAQTGVEIELAQPLSLIPLPAPETGASGREDESQASDGSEEHTQ